MPLQEGDAAPDFSLPDQTGATVSLKALRGKPVVLFFYPRASTPGCTIEAREFRDAYARFQKQGIVLLGASPDPVKSQKKFCDAESLPFPLLADEDKTLARKYGVLKPKNMYGRQVVGVARTTFLIDAQGRLRRILSGVKPEGHAAQVLEELRGLGDKA